MIFLVLMIVAWISIHHNRQMILHDVPCNDRGQEDSKPLQLLERLRTRL